MKSGSHEIKAACVETEQIIGESRLGCSRWYASTLGLVRPHSYLHLSKSCPQTSPEGAPGAACIFTKSGIAPLEYRHVPDISKLGKVMLYLGLF